MNKDLIAILREEIRQARRQLNEDTVEPSPGGHWSMGAPPEEAPAEEPPISPEQAGLSAVEDRAYELIQMMQEMAQESPEEAQEALGALTAVLEEAGMLDAMCSTTQGTIGFHREGLTNEIKNILVEIMDEPEFGFGPENEPRIDWPKRHLDVEAEAGVNEAMDNAVHRAKMANITKEDLAELFASAVHASYEENA
jgi:hypothetical protein